MMERFRYEADPDLPGWTIWELKEQERFNHILGPLRVRTEGEGKARCRIIPDRRLSNYGNSVHGGALLGFIDISLFAGAYACGARSAADGVTLDCAVQFLSPGRLDEPLDAVVELLRETGRLLFLRGIVEQSQGNVAAFSATVRKLVTAR